ncbi:hypothetical protein KIPE111705_27910 [Kibdelosporangium persicum]|uniref:Uncharacterized protein n=1 Tax=Kibdelosporangium persicum TaxID=2698649 RepID=A0ABX2FHP7_9PSEU|nr:hypothetical protein [Kibdelosporangium persicum]NRN70321.1 hypothetical protein [Kibdelosporangium persicum]
MITQPEQITETELAPGCTVFSWTPEVHDFYGDPASILHKIDNQDMALSDRRIFVLLTESEGRANVRFFEQVDGKNYSVSTWTGDSLDGLNGRLADTILTNKGVHCVGEQVRALLGSVDLELAATVPAPANARAAFAHTIREHGEQTFTRATCALLC